MRRFTFFDKEVVKDPDTNQTYTGLEVPAAGVGPLPSVLTITKTRARRQQIVVEASATGRGTLTFGDREGFVHFVDRSFQITTFKAFEFKVTHLLQLRQCGILITVGVRRGALLFPRRGWAGTRSAWRAHPSWRWGARMTRRASAPPSRYRFAVPCCTTPK